DAMSWMQMERYLARDDRAVFPIGSTEQHAYLSLAADNVLAERVAVEAAEPLGVPVFPVLAYGVTPSFRAYPGTVSLRNDTLIRIMGDVLDSLSESGFRRIFVVNGHGGNSTAQTWVAEWLADHPGIRVKFHNWWNAPLTLAQVHAIDAFASHASWMENFPWTRLEGVTSPAERKPMVDLARMRTLDARGARDLLGDGNFGGLYQRPDADTAAIWKVAVEETRALIAEGWST